MPALVQSASNTGTSGTSVTVTLGSNTTAGNCLVVCIGGIAGSAPSVSTVTIGGSADHFALAKKQAVVSFADGDCEVWTDQNIGVSSTSVVVTFSAAQTDIYVWVMEWSGIATSAAVDKTNSGSTTASPSSSGSTGLLTNASEVIIGASLADGAAGESQAGPASPWTNLAQISAGNGSLVAGYQIVSATTAQTYSATISGGNGVFMSAAVIITLTEAALGPAGTVQPPATLPPARRRPGRALWQRITGQAFVKVPAPAWQPRPAPRRKPARAVLMFTPVRTTNAAAAAPVTGTVQPRATIPVPRRRAARVVARGLAVPGIYPVAPAQQYRTPPRRTRSRAYVRFTPVRTANAFIPRTLLIALASKAGTDDYGNTYPQGIFASAGVIEGPEVIAGTAPLTQVVLTDNGAGAGEVQFQPNDSRFLFGAINSEVIGSPNYDSMGIIGPASTAPGHGDFVEEAFNSANAAGTSTANWQIFYIDPSGGGHLVAVVDANGFTVSGNLIVDGTASLNDGATVTNGLTTDTLNVTGGTIDLAGGAASLTENNFNMASPMGTLPGYPLPTDGNTGSSWATGERAFINNCVNAINALVAELQNRGMMS